MMKIHEWRRKSRTSMLGMYGVNHENRSICMQICQCQNKLFVVEWLGNRPDIFKLFICNALGSIPTGSRSICLYRLYSIGQSDRRLHLTAIWKPHLFLITELGYWSTLPHTLHQVYNPVAVEVDQKTKPWCSPSRFHMAAFIIFMSLGAQKPKFPISLQLWFLKSINWNPFNYSDR